MASSMIVGFVFIAGWVLINGLLWPYTINTWLEFFGKPDAVFFWHGMLIGLIPLVNRLVVPAAIITLIAMLIIG